LSITEILDEILNEAYNQLLSLQLALHLVAWLFHLTSLPLSNNTFVTHLITWTINYLICVSAVLYHRWGKLHEAEQHYLVALQLDSTNGQTAENYQRLKRKMSMTT
jgi:hypothetical protein